MQPYLHADDDTGVTAFELRRDGIVVQFVSGETYLYTNASAGADNIARMRELARDGRGLSTFISQHVHGRYARKLT